MPFLFKEKANSDAMASTFRARYGWKEQQKRLRMATLNWTEPVAGASNVLTSPRPDAPTCTA
jgi:hypothetical protein